MDDLEERLRRHADAVIGTAPPVTVDEIRARHPRRHPRLGRVLTASAVALAAAVLLTMVVVTRRQGSSTNVAAGTEPALTLDGQTAWQLGILNGTLHPTDADIKVRFTDSFLAAVPPAKFRSEVAPLGSRGPWRVLAEVERRDDTVLAVQLVSAGEEQVRLTLHRAGNGRFDGSTILAAVPCAAAVDPSMPLSPQLADQLAWTKQVLASSSELSDDELRQRFAPSFLAQVPLAELPSAIAKLRALGPYTFRNYEGPPSTYQLMARVGVRTGEEARLTLAVETTTPHRITALAIFTQAPCTLANTP